MSRTLLWGTKSLDKKVKEVIEYEKRSLVFLFLWEKRKELQSSEPLWANTIDPSHFSSCLPWMFLFCLLMVGCTSEWGHRSGKNTLILYLIWILKHCLERLRKVEEKRSYGWDRGWHRRQIQTEHRQSWYYGEHLRGCCFLPIRAHSPFVT